MGIDWMGFGGKGPEMNEPHPKEIEEEREIARRKEKLLTKEDARRHANADEALRRRDFGEDFRP